MLAYGVHAPETERTLGPNRKHSRARSWGSVGWVSQGVVWLQRLSLALVLVLGSVQSVVPAPNMQRSTTESALPSVADSGAELHRVSHKSDRVLGVDNRSAFEPVAVDCESAEEAAPDYARFVRMARPRPYHAAQRPRRPDATSSVQRLVESSRPRGPPQT